jgi:hypothetical protein
MKELDFSKEIRAQLEQAEGTEEEVTQEAWAAEEKKGKRLNKPFRTSGGPKKFSVYVKNEKGNVVKVNFGDPNMEIKRDDPARRKSFRARHNCDSPGPKTKAKYWSCKMWSKKSVTKMTKGNSPELLEAAEEELAAELDESESKQGLWDNIRKKKKREGKDYKPAKPGDKDRPSKEAWKKAQDTKSDAENDKDDKKEDKLTEKQKKLPEAIQKSILDKKKKSKAEEKDFEPHDMYDPETGKAYKAKSYEEHMKYKKMGYTHEKPSESGYKSKKKKKY